MKPLIERLAYKLCCTEVKMLIDKLDDLGQMIGTGYKPLTRHGLVGISQEGRFTIGERIALALMFRRHHRTNTKSAIVQSIFEGEMKERQDNIAGAFTTTTYAPYIPGETIAQYKTRPSAVITSADITREALKVLEQEMSNTKQWSEADKHYREQGML